MLNNKSTFTLCCFLFASLVPKQNLSRHTLTDHCGALQANNVLTSIAGRTHCARSATLTAPGPQLHCPHLRVHPDLNRYVLLSTVHDRTSYPKASCLTWQRLQFVLPQLCRHNARCMVPIHTSFCNNLNALKDNTIPST
jgi:hypothetical protein